MPDCNKKTPKSEENPGTSAKKRQGERTLRECLQSRLVWEWAGTAVPQILGKLPHAYYMEGLLQENA